MEERRRRRCAIDVDDERGLAALQLLELVLETGRPQSVSDGIDQAVEPSCHVGELAALLVLMDFLVAVIPIGLRRERCDELLHQLGAMRWFLRLSRMNSSSTARGMPRRLSQVPI